MEVTPAILHVLTYRKNIGNCRTLQKINRLWSSELTDNRKDFDMPVNNPISNPRLYPVITTIWIVVMVLVIATCGAFELNQFESIALWRQLLFIGAIAWIATSIQVIKLDEVVALTSFGYPVKNMGPGLKIIPRILFTIHRFQRSVQQKQFPGDPEEVFGGDDKDELPSGMVRALRITTGEPQSSRNTPLNIQMVLEFLYYLRVQIEDPLVFVITFGSISGFWKQIRDTGDRILTKRVTQSTGAADLIQNIGDIMDGMDDRFKELASEGGVSVIETGLTAPNISHTLAEAIRNIGVSKADAESTKVAAEAERIKLTKEGAGRASAEAALIKAIETEIKDAGIATVAAYAGQRVLGDKTVVLGAEGIAQAFGLGQTIVKGE